MLLVKIEPHIWCAAFRWTANNLIKSSLTFRWRSLFYKFMVQLEFVLAKYVSGVIVLAKSLPV